MDAIDEYGLGVGEMVQDIPHRPLLGRVAAREIAIGEREAFQGLVACSLQLSNESRGRLQISLPEG